jgi:hypothetical protein
MLFVASFSMICSSFSENVVRGFGSAASAFSGDDTPPLEDLFDLPDSAGDTFVGFFGEGDLGLLVDGDFFGETLG